MRTFLSHVLVTVPPSLHFSAFIKLLLPSWKTLFSPLYILNFVSNASDVLFLPFSFSIFPLHRAIMNLLTEEQQQRYESFRRSSLKEPMKKLIQVISGSKPDSQSKIMIALCSVSKTFVGELVEEAKRVAEEDDHKGPLQPTHVMEGYQRLMAAGLVESIEHNGRPKMKL